MKPVPTHHRAVALLLAVASVAAIARAAPPPVVAPLAREAPARPPQRIDPRTADARALEELPGVGPALARRIVAARARGVVFRRPEDLLRVRGIGPAKLARMRDRLDFGDQPVTGRSATTRPP
jgi:DNA uptake protein ComE-like DNA-binding protein